MKLLFITEFYPPVVRGGAEISTNLLVDALSKNHDVDVLTQRKIPSSNPHVISQLYDISSELTSFSEIVRYLTINILINPIRNLFVINTFIKNGAYDFVTLELTSFQQLPYLLLAFNKKVKWAVGAHSGAALCPVEYSKVQCYPDRVEMHKCFSSLSQIDPKWNSIYKFLSYGFASYKLFLFKFYSHIFKFVYDQNLFSIICISKYVENLFIANGFNKSNLKVIHNIQTKSKQIKSTRRKFQIAFACRLEPSKGVAEMISGFEKADIPNLKLLIAGDGSMRNYVKEKSRNNSNIIYLGKINQEDVIRLYSESLAVIAVPNMPEPDGRMWMEALVTSTPSILSKVGGIPEHIQHNRHGLLVTPGDINQISSAIRKLALNRPFWTRLNSNLKIKFANYKPETDVTQRVVYYNYLLKNKST